MADPDTTAGRIKSGKGQFKEVVGRVLGDTEIEAEGAAEKVSGKIQEGFGKTKEAIRGAAHGISKAADRN